MPLLAAGVNPVPRLSFVRAKGLAPITPVASTKIEILVLPIPQNRVDMIQAFICEYALPGQPFAGALEDLCHIHGVPFRGIIACVKGVTFLVFRHAPTRPIVAFLPGSAAIRRAHHGKVSTRYKDGAVRAHKYHARWNFRISD